MTTLRRMSTCIFVTGAEDRWHWLRPQTLYQSCIRVGGLPCVKTFFFLLLLTEVRREPKLYNGFVWKASVFSSNISYYIRSKSSFSMYVRVWKVFLSARVIFGFPPTYYNIQNAWRIVIKIVWNDNLKAWIQLTQ